jgi:hypothetical protein
MSGSGVAIGEESPLSEGISGFGVATREPAPLSEGGPSSISTTRKCASWSKTKSPPSSIKKQSRGVTQTHLWTQKFGKKEITNKKQLCNTIKYIRNNRQKHGLPENKGLSEVIKKMIQTNT